MRSPLFLTTLLVVLLSQSVNAATYNVTSNNTFNSVIGGSSCTSCIFNITPGKTLTFNSGTCDGCTFTGGSVNIAGNTSFPNHTTSFNNVTVAVNYNVTFTAASFFGSSVTLASFVAMQVNNAMTVDNTDIYLNPLSAVTASGTPVSVQNGSNITLTDLAVFTVSNTLPVSASTITMNTVFFPAQLTAAAITMTGSQLTVTGASSIIQSNNNFDATSSTISLNSSSAITASSSTLTSTALTLNTSSSMTVTNGLDLKSSTAVLNGSSNITANTVTLESNSSALIGDGTAGGAAWLKAANGLKALDNSQLAIAPGGRDYYTTGVSSFTGGTTTYSLTNNHINCNYGSVTSHANSCNSSRVYGCATMNKFGAIGCISLALGDIDLRARVAGTNAVSLSWSDPLSAVASQYEVQRCTDGYNYTTIFTTTATAENYHYTDAAAPSGKTVDYRIVRTGKDGQSSYSDISTVTLASTTTDVQLYPNPTAGHNFFITTPTTAELDASIFTISGQLLTQTRLKGQTRYPIHLPSGIAPGSTVVVRVSERQNSQTFTVLVD
ncbi:MAG: T9SS type A sorting domain-containing protein [Bacteroidetes bacterium]|nr:T9SS type A sorting domain-containing protein [Bacteroidota bacterium]